MLFERVFPTIWRWQSILNVPIFVHTWWQHCHCIIVVNLIYEIHVQCFTRTVTMWFIFNCCPLMKGNDFPLCSLGYSFSLRCMYLRNLIFHVQVQLFAWMQVRLHCLLPKYARLWSRHKTANMFTVYSLCNPSFHWLNKINLLKCWALISEDLTANKHIHLL